MIWALIKKEMLANMLTLRLVVALVLTIFLSAFTTLIGSWDFSHSMQVYKQQADEHRSKMKEVTTYSQLKPDVIVPPQAIRIFSRGVVETSALRVGISVYQFVYAAESVGASLYDDLMQTLNRVDFTSVVTILLSFLAVMLGFDGISGEKERGTLKLLLSNPIPRGKVILAKLAGGLLSLWIPLALAFMVSLIIVSNNTDVSLVADDWLRLLMLYGLSCAFLGQVFLFSLMISSFVQNSSTSLVVSLFFWLLGGIGYINILPAMARYGVQEAPWQDFVDQRSQEWKLYRGKVAEWERANAPPGKAHIMHTKEGRWWEPRLRYMHPEGIEWYERRYEFALDKALETADRLTKLRWANAEPMAREQQLVDSWSVLSPFTNYRTLSQWLMRSTVDDRFYVADFGRRYRETFINYLRSKDVFSDKRWFTDDPDWQEPLVPEPDIVTDDMLRPSADYYKRRMEWAQAQDKKIQANPRPGLDLDDMPRYGGEWKRSLGETLGEMIPGLAVMLLTSCLGLMITTWRFLTYEPH